MKRLIATTAGLLLAGSALASGALDYHDNYGSVLIEPPTAATTTPVQPGFGSDSYGHVVTSIEHNAMQRGGVDRGEDAYGSVLFDLSQDIRHFEY